MRLWRRRTEVQAETRRELDEAIIRNLQEREEEQRRRDWLNREMAQRERIPEEERWPTTDLGRRVLRVAESAARGAGACNCQSVWIESERAYLKRCQMSEDTELRAWGELT